MLPVILPSTNDGILEATGPQAEAEKFPGGTREVKIKNNVLLVMEGKLYAYIAILIYFSIF